MMMSNLSDFAKLIKQAKEERQSQEILEKQRISREVTPLLSDLFVVVSDAKKANPLCEVVPQKHTSEIPTQASAQPTSSEINFNNIVVKLQKDIASLQRQINSKPPLPTYGYSSAGSGEVRILRMDDVNAQGIEQDSILSYDLRNNKFGVYQSYDKIFSNIIEKQTVINVDMSYTVIGYLKIKNTLYVKGNLGIR
jgi:hypothetical protein